MAKALVSRRKIQMGIKEIIKFQLINYCFVHNISCSDAELDCLTLLGLYGECELAEFCNSAVDEEIFKVPQTVRNFLTKAQKLKFVEKNGTSRKKIKLHKDLNMLCEGNIVLDYKIYHLSQNQLVPDAVS